MGQLQLSCKKKYPSQLVAQSIRWCKNKHRIQRLSVLVPNKSDTQDRNYNRNPCILFHRQNRFAVEKAAGVAGVVAVLDLVKARLSKYLLTESTAFPVIHYYDAVVWQCVTWKPAM